MNDFSFPDWSSNGFVLPNVSANAASHLYVDDRTAQRELSERNERLKNASQSEIEAENARAAREQYQQVDFNLIEPIDEFIERACYNPLTVNPVSLDITRGQLIVLRDHQRRILRHIFTPSQGSVSKYVTVIWSEPKKSGKTKIAACVVAYFAEYVDPPNQIIIVANKKDQAKGRIYKSAMPDLKGLGANVPTGRTSVPEIRMPNGTIVKAIPNSPAEEAGDFYCLTAWSEIWAFKSETDARLFAELMPVEIMRVSMQWIETYVGYTDESMTLLELWKNFFDDTDGQKLAKGANYVPELEDIRTGSGRAERPACIENPDKEMFLFWSHERQMPWQTEKAKRREWTKLGKVEAVRLLENRWQASSSEALDENWILASVRPREFDKFKGRPFVLAVDAAMRHNTIALVGSFEHDETYYSPFVEIHDPEGEDADLHQLVENRVKHLFDEGLLFSYIDETDGNWKTTVFFDIFQLHQVRLNLIEYGIDVREFSQAGDRYKADTMLYHLYKDQRIVNPDHLDHLNQLRGGKAKYVEGEVIRFIKGTTKDAKQNDSLVAQSMSCYGQFLINQIMLKQEDPSSFLLQDETDGGWLHTETE